MKTYAVVVDSEDSEMVPQVLATYATLRAARNFADRVQGKVYVRSGSDNWAVPTWMDELSPRVIHGQIWFYYEGTGWYYRGWEVISRSEANNNHWVRWNGRGADDYADGAKYKSLGDAVAQVRSI